MNRCSCLALLVCSVLNPGAQSQQTADRREAEYYVGAYAAHYNVPVRFVRALVEQESSWHPCAVSPKGAVGLMQLMPMTATRLGVRDRCNIAQNVSGGVRYLAWLMRMFQGDPRLAAAAYLAGEEVIARRGLLYRNREVVAYVSRIRKSYQRQLAEGNETFVTALRSRAVR
jgi:soluble lytic murein transglycosylase-like protein